MFTPFHKLEPNTKYFFIVFLINFLLPKNICYIPCSMNHIVRFLQHSYQNPAGPTDSTKNIKPESYSNPLI